jgi:iron complex outermembrane receptor protein
MADMNLSAAKNSETFTKTSIATLSTHANMNPYTVIAYAPSVHFTPVDAGGSNEPSYHDPIRIRGKSQSGPGGVFMLNSMPLSSNPGGGKQMLDMENVASIDLLKGYLPVDKNLGFSSLIGKVDMRVLAPKKSASATLSQSFGADNFKRTFVRFDSGNLGDISLFGSLSVLSNDKNKGEGELDRVNGMIGVSYKPNDTFRADVYAIRNSDAHHNYGSLSYAQTKDLDANYNNDFATTKPTTANDVDYYDWNKQDFLTTNIFADILYMPSSDDTIKIKPYYKEDKGEYWFSKPNAVAAKSRVMDWQMDHDLYGVVASYEHAFSQELKSKIGYWYHKQLPPGPPSDQRKYKVDASGNLVFDGYAILSDNDYHILQTPFVELSGEVANFVYSAGVQYQNFELGSITARTGTTAATSTDYDTALAQSAVDAWASVDAKTFKTWMPSLYMAYKLDATSAFYMDYSRSYGFDVNLFPTYVSNRATFVGKGITMQELWDKLELETSDNIDFGYKTTLGGVNLHPSLFVSFVRNKQANIYDADLDVNYPANLGDAFGYGAEFSASGALSESLEFLASLSYNHYSFDEDFAVSATQRSDIKGNQLPDAPEVMAKVALSYYVGAFSVTPSARYTSSRYGDVANTEEIDAYTLVDLDISYKPTELFGSKHATIRTTVSNLTNEKYIATITTPDNVLAASTTSSTYQTGAPFGMFVSLNLQY